MGGFESGFELVPVVGVEQLDGDVVTGPHPGELVEQLMPVLFGALVNNVMTPVSGICCHLGIVAAPRQRHQRPDDRR